MQNTLLSTTGIERINTLNEIGTYYIEHGDYDKALPVLEEELKLSKEIGYKNGLALSLGNFGNYYYYQGNYPKALEYMFQSMEIRKEEGKKKEIVLIYQNVGIYYEALGNYAKSLEYYLLSLTGFEEIKDTFGIAMGKMNVGLVYKEMGDTLNEMSYYLEGLHLFTAVKHKRGMALCYSNIGNYYKDRNDFKPSLENHLQALKYFDEVGDKYNLAHEYLNTGEIYKYSGDYKKALEFYFHALDDLQEMNSQLGIAACLNNIGETYSFMREYDTAIEYLEKSLSVSKGIGFKELMSETSRILSETSFKMNNYREALRYFKYHVGVQDSLLSETTTKQLAEMQTKYESEKKEKEIQILKKDQEIQKSEVARQKLMRNSFIGASMLALLLALLLYNRYQIKRRANIHLSEQNEKIMMQKNVIEEQKQNITDSIEYASNIQKAMLPTDDEFKRLFPESFILYRPRDIVSGDFYWVASPPSYPPVGGMAISPFPTGEVGRGASPPPTGEAGRGAVLLATADCTGHGVPGAFMSMLCTALLNESVNDKGLTRPDEIFEEIRKGIIAALKQENGLTGRTKDGMDATIISINGTYMRTTCANNPVYIVSKGILTEIKPDRFPVGVYERILQPFTLQEAQLQQGDMIYTLTDGFEDQLGGEKGKKFKSVKLRERLISISSKPLIEQRDILEKTLDEWKGGGEQTDDVIIIGIKV